MREKSQHDECTTFCEKIFFQSKRRTKKKRPKKLTTTTIATTKSGDGFWRKRSLSDSYDHDIYDDGSDYYDDGSDYRGFDENDIFKANC